MMKGVCLSVTVCSLFILGCICLPPEIMEELETSELFSAKPIKNITETPTISTTTTLKLIESTRMIIYETINKSMDISGQQEITLKNLKPKYCNTATCSTGFFMCKENVLDILNIKNLYKFSERASSGAYGIINKVNEEQEWIPVKMDNFTKFIKLKRSIWYMDVNSENITINKWKEPEKFISLNRSQYYQQHNEEWIILRKV